MALVKAKDGSRTDWNTPEDVLKAVREFDEIGLDPCSNATSIVKAKTEWILIRDGDSLTKSWLGHDLVFVNPPYGREIKQWAEHIAFYGSACDVEIIALVPANTETKWFRHLWLADAICFWGKRVRFVGATSSQTGPSALVYFGSRKERFKEVFSNYGKVVFP